jgi:hypothetical protein
VNLDGGSDSRHNQGALASEAPPKLSEPTLVARVRAARDLFFDGITEAPPVIDTTRVVEARPSRQARFAPYRRAAFFALLGLLGATLMVVTAPVWRLAAPNWRLTIAGIPHPGGPMFSAVTFLVGLAGMVFGWVGLVGQSGRTDLPEHRRIRMVAVVFALWCVPVLLGPPLLSNDVYSYAAQGELAARGFDPTSDGPYMLPRGEYLTATDPVWRASRAPYGPVAIASSEIVARVTFHNAAATVWALRLVSLLGIALAGVGVLQIARRSKVSPPLALAMAIANPVVLVHLVGGAHNDALMMGLLVYGVALALRNKWTAAVVLVALATAVKLPAIAALPFMAWVRTGPDARLRERLREAARMTGLLAAVVAALSVVAWVGPGWITALRGTGTSYNTFSVSTKVGFVVADFANGRAAIPIDAFGAPGPGLAGGGLLVALVRLLGLAAAGVISLVLLHRSPTRNLARSIGLCLLAVILLGPVVWPWYLPVGFALLAASGLRTWRPASIVAIAVTAGLVFPTSVNRVPTLSRWQQPLGLALIVAVVAIALCANRVVPWFRERAPRGLWAPEPVDSLA